MLRDTFRTIPNAAASANTLSLYRVNRIVVKFAMAIINRTCTAAADQVNLVWRVMDVCAAAEPCCGRNTSENVVDSIPSAVRTIEVYFFSHGRTQVKLPVIGPLTTRYPSLISSLHSLAICDNKYDESADLGCFAAEAIQLRTLTILGNLTSLRGLEGKCEYLRKVNVWGCSRLTSLEGLGHRQRLEEVNASFTAISSVEPLLTCPALTNVKLGRCTQLPADALLPAILKNQ